MGVSLGRTQDQLFQPRQLRGDQRHSEHGTDHGHEQQGSEGFACDYLLVEQDVGKNDQPLDL